MSKTILYDLANRQKSCWSLNPWKTRLALNFKQIPYETQWVEYPDLKSTLSELGIKPNAEGFAYTSPAIKFSDGTYMQDSRKIADKLEELHPSPGMQLDAPVLKEVEEWVLRARDPLAPILMPLIPRLILPERSAEYFRETRAKRFGMPLDDFEKSEQGGENAWKKLHVLFEELAHMLRREGGPFFLSDGASYADFVIAGVWRFMERPDEKILERALAFDQVLRDHYQACLPWLERDD